MFIIVSDAIFNGETMYLGWQNSAWDDDGYFWTSKDIISEIMENNTLEHPFLFDTKNDARELARRIRLSKFSIESW